MKIKTLCMALLCREYVVRDSFNFGTGFCPKCQEKYDENFLEMMSDEQNQKL